MYPNCQAIARFLTVLAAAAVEERERIADLQAQYLDVASHFVGQREDGARLYGIIEKKTGHGEQSEREPLTAADNEMPTAAAGTACGNGRLFYC